MDNTFLEHHGVKGMKWGVRGVKNIVLTQNPPTKQKTQKIGG